MRKREKNWEIKVRWVSLVFVVVIVCTTLAGFFGQYLNNKRLEAEINKINNGISGDYVSTLPLEKPFKQLSDDQFEINNENQTISFSEDIQEGTFCVTQNPNGPDASDVWQPIVKDSVIQLQNVKDDDLTRVRVYYLATIAKSMTNYSDDVNAYTISTAAELTAFATRVNAGNTFSGKTVYLMANITLPSNFTPIGTTANPFEGIFDGNGYSIEGINIQLSDTDKVGIFGVVNGGTIKNITTKGTQVKGGNITGAVVGQLLGNGIIENCTNEVPIEGTSNVGGIVGSAAGTIQYCQNYATVTTITNNFSGGIIGVFNGNTTVINCKNTGNITSAQYGAGGIIGAGETGVVNIKNCTNSGKINAVSGTVGGIFGGIVSDSYSGHEITYCKNTGAIIGGSHAGGIIGAIYNGTVDRCINTATLTINISYVGGIVGSAKNIVVSNSLNQGYIDVRGGSVGGIIGYGTGTSEIKFCGNTASIYAGGSSRLSNYEPNYQGYGGIVGWADKPFQVTACYNKGDVRRI